MRKKAKETQKEEREREREKKIREEGGKRRKSTLKEYKLEDGER